MVSAMSFVAEQTKHCAYCYSPGMKSQNSIQRQLGKACCQRKEISWYRSVRSQAARGLSIHSPVYIRDHWPEDELDNVEKHPYREESPYRHLGHTIKPLPKSIVLKSIECRPLTSKQYPNSNCSRSSACTNSPCCRLRPGKPAIPGPSNRPTKK